MSNILRFTFKRAVKTSWYVCTVLNNNGRIYKAIFVTKRTKHLNYENFTKETKEDVKEVTESSQEDSELW